MGRTRTGAKYNPWDNFYHKAKKEGFVARSVFKLDELEKKYHFYRSGMKVLDLGCAPGSWLQYAAQKVGSKGQLVGFDIEDVRVSLPQVQTFVADLLELQVDDPRVQAVAPFDFIQSDAMVKTSGIADSDCYRSIELVEKGLSLAEQGWLAPGGHFLAKVFEGPGFPEFYVAFKRKFKRTAVKRPEATRRGSREVYVVGLEYRGQP